MLRHSNRCRPSVTARRSHAPARPRGEYGGSAANRMAGASSSRLCRPVAREGAGVGLEHRAGRRGRGRGSRPAAVSNRVRYCSWLAERRPAWPAWTCGHVLRHADDPPHGPVASASARATDRDPARLVADADPVLERRRRTRRRAPAPPCRGPRPEVLARDVTARSIARGRRAPRPGRRSGAPRARPSSARSRASYVQTPIRAIAWACWRSASLAASSASCAALVGDVAPDGDVVQRAAEPDRADARSPRPGPRRPSAAGGS